MQVDGKFFFLQDRFLESAPDIFKEISGEEEKEAFLKERWSFLNRRESVAIRCYNPVDVYPQHASVIEINLKNIPFIVETVLDYLQHEGYKILRFHYFLFTVERRNGEIVTIDTKNTETPHDESYLYMEIERLPSRKLEELERDLKSNLEDLLLMVEDFPLIRKKIQGFTFSHQEMEKEKIWVFSNFISMGLVELSQEKEILANLGLGKRQEVLANIEPFWKNRSMIPESGHEGILYLESGIRSKVKRNKPLLLVFFLTESGDFVLLGSFANKGEIAPRFLIPGIKEKIDGICHEIGATVNSYLYKEIYKISQLIPLGILFTRRREILRDWFDFLVKNLFTSEQKILINRDADYNGVWVIMLEPQKFALRQVKINRNLALHGISIHTYFRKTYNPYYITFLFLKKDGVSPDALFEYLHENTKNIFFSWFSEFLNILYRNRHRLPKIYKTEQYLAIFPDTLSHFLSPEETINLLEHFYHVESEDYPFRFYIKFCRARSNLEEKESYALSIITREPYYLSDVFPVLDSFGFVISSEVALDFHFPEGKKYLLLVFFHNDIPPEWHRKIEEGIQTTFNGYNTLEKMNSLLLTTPLSIREILLLKTLFSFYYQAYKQYSRIYLQNFAIQHGNFCVLIITYLKKRFESYRQSLPDLEKEITSYIAAIKTLSELLIANHIWEIAKAITRTNYFLNFREITVKVHARSLSFLPEPKPLYAAFVYSRDFEGVHLRSDEIARGGIRWSDRVDDFFVEIYDLMKTQMVKNTVIVPGGAKGGFVIKKEKNILRQENHQDFVREVYKRFIRNLLSITDNIVDGKITTPEGIVKYDRDDPYLVVAADKGTATFSDVANAVAREFRFWLDDAFASGGSNGYDHKKQGITAKGAWESVKRHFSELGVDPEKDTVTVIGIGDMSGDVFGNGMLLSRTIKLIAAFNHKHIFIDTEPDPEKSYRERLRLFREARGWDYYSRELLQDGGGVFERNSAKIRISEKIKKMLDIPVDEVSGEELIRYILRAKADLLWNGGIGTYIKSSHETDAEVKDPANDSVRIDAKDLRVKVVAEGGNLGLTYKGRVEAARNNILLNTDFIDNSGGVDMSDHEVNLKIFLQILKKENKIDEEQKNHIIKQFENDMIKKVLDNNIFNNLAISLDILRLNENILLNDWIKELKKHQFLFDYGDTFSGTRPEVAVLLGATKLFFKNYFLGRKFSFPEETVFMQLRDYFPSSLVEDYREEILRHPLRYEIFAVFTINEIINTFGMLYFFRHNLIFHIPYETVLRDYLEWKKLTGLHILEIYRQFRMVPGKILYPRLVAFTEILGSFHFLEKKPVVTSGFRDIFSRFLSLAAKQDEDELPAFLKALEVSILYFYLGGGIEPGVFFSYLFENEVLAIRDRILQIKAVNLQEVKFQAYLVKTLYQILPFLIKEKRKINIAGDGSFLSYFHALQQIKEELKIL